MSELYNRRFKIGASLWVTAMVTGNIFTYVAALRRDRGHISFSPYSFPAWGFPFNWDGGLASASNLGFVLLGALLFGLLFRWISGCFK